jgi:glycosyltransferase involved in cell wall biosynthesis
MALKTPCITTSLANDAIDMKVGEEIIVANSLEEMIDAISLLLSDEEKRNDIANKAFQKVEQDFRWSKINKQLITLIQTSIQSKNEQ